VFTQFCAETPHERREKLMPFVWNVIGKEGQLYGNRKHNNKMQLTNMNMYSYAGYSEMFVGFADRRVRSNAPKPNPNYTVLEALNKTEGYEGKVAAFSTWNIMPFILRKGDSGIHINSGEDKARSHALTGKEKALNFLTDEMPNPHGDRYDAFTFQYAMEYLKRESPRVLFISFDETDEHGHGGRYDEYLKSAHRADRMISELWDWVQSNDAYKDQTTLILATDHGRGKSPKGWKRHAILFRGSAQVWLGIIGPDTPPTGEMKNFARLKQTQIAQTIAAFLNVPYQQEKPTGNVITSAFIEGDVQHEDALSSGSTGQ
jgi:hypothetical protein